MAGFTNENEAVVAIQKWLNSHYDEGDEKRLVEDGIAGPLTRDEFEQRFKELQLHLSYSELYDVDPKSDPEIQGDGIYGDLTQAALDKKIESLADDDPEKENLIQLKSALDYLKDDAKVELFPPRGLKAYEPVGIVEVGSIVFVSAEKGYSIFLNDEGIPEFAGNADRFAQDYQDSDGQEEIKGQLVEAFKGHLDPEGTGLYDLASLESLKDKIGPNITYIGTDQEYYIGDLAELALTTVEEQLTEKVKSPLVASFDAACKHCGPDSLEKRGDEPQVAANTIGVNPII